jgi:ATP adenylyltransferase
MEQLWAPWRIQYILGQREPGCFLCTKPGTTDDAKNLLLIRAKSSFLMLNAYPYNPGHLLVAPYRHTDDLASLGDETLTEMQHLLIRGQALLTRAMKPHGFNLGLNLGRVAGAGVLDHLHWHIVPRWEGDCNFMPVTGSTRVIPQALDDLFIELHKHLAADPITP